MFIFNKSKPISFLLGLTLASSTIILNGCGGGGGDSEKDVNVSGVTEVKLKKSLKDGLTKGLDSNVETMSSTFETVSDSFNNDNKPKYLAGISASINTVSGLSKATDEIVEKFNLLIDNSTSTNNGSVYTFDPDETTICADSSLNNNTPAKIADCETVLSNITFTSTIVATNNTTGDVTAADTDFKYSGATFSKLGFSSGNSAYYEIVLNGMSALLTGFNTIITDPNDKFDIPDTMTGSLRLASSAQSPTSGTFTISVPSAISIIDAAPNNTAIDIGQTGSLFSVTANSTANTMNVSIGINAVDILTTNDNNPSDTFAQQLVISALSGQVVVSNNGNTITLTGITANGIELKLDGTQALMANLAPLTATLISTNNTQKVATLNSVLDFDLIMTNARYFLDDNDPVTHAQFVKLDAASGTSLQAVAGNDLIKVTTGSITAESTSTGNASNTVTVPVNSCLDPDDFSLDSSANCQ